MTVNYVTDKQVENWVGDEDTLALILRIGMEIHAPPPI